MTLYEERILYELARYNLPRKIIDIAKACRLAPKTTRQAIHSLTEKGLLTASHAIKNPLPWRLPPELHSQRLPAKTFMAAAEIHKHPELSHAEIALRAQTSKATAIRAEQILSAITRQSRLKRAEQKQKNISTNNRTLTQRQIHERKREQKRLEEHQRQIHEENLRWRRIHSLREKLKQIFNPFQQTEILREIEEEKKAIQKANFEAMQTAKREF